MFKTLRCLDLHYKKYNAFFAATFISATLAAAAPLHAQELEDIQVIIKPQLQIEQNRELRRIVRQRGEAFVKSKRAEEAPADSSDPLTYNFFALDGGEPVLQKNSLQGLAGGALFLSLKDGQAAQADAPASLSGWNFWVDGKRGHIEDANPARSYEGGLYSINAGADTSVSDRLSLGFLALGTGSDVDLNFGGDFGESETGTFGTGGYISYLLTDTVALTGLLVHNWTENDSRIQAVTASYDSRAWNANLSIASYHFVGNWQLVPSAGLSYSHERDESYADSAGTVIPASTTRIGTATIGGSVSYTQLLENGMAVSPSLELNGEYTFLKSVSVPSASATADDQKFDANLSAGLDIQIDTQTSLGLSATVNGLAKPDFYSATAGGRFSVKF